MVPSRDREPDGPDDSAVGGERTQVAQYRYDPDHDAELTSALVFALAKAEDVHPMDLQSPRLYEVIDAPAIEEAFFPSEVSGGPQHHVGVTQFHYEQYLVRVRSDGWIRVYESTDQS